MSTAKDLQISAAAAGFTLGFGFLVTWEAIKQTRANRSPLRSIYIYMVWGEILANLVITIMAFLLLHGVIAPTVVVLFFALVIWTFQIQFQLQIILNRINIITDNKRLVRKLKIGTVIATSMICVSVFCIWIPAHMVPPVNSTFVNINKYWDKIQKGILCVIDAGLNYFFLRTVRVRLVNYYGLRKYAPLVSFNAKLIVFSVSTDILLIAVMLFSNTLLFTQFQALVYVVKLNIELCMASLIARLARGHPENDMMFGHGGTHNEHLTNRSTTDQQNTSNGPAYAHGCSASKRGAVELKDYDDHKAKGCKNPIRSFVSKVETGIPRRNDSRDIMRRTDLQIVVAERDAKSSPTGSDYD